MDRINSPKEEAWKMDAQPRCNKKLSLAPRDPETGAMVLGTVKIEICNGILALKERIVHANGVDFVYVCTRCGARKIFNNCPTDDTAEDSTRKAIHIQDAEDKILEENR